MVSTRLPEMVVINLERSQERLAAFRQRSGLAAQVIPRLNAIEGQTLALDALLARNVLDRTALDWPRGQLGCALSHIKALMHCRRRGEPLLIFEDDALFAPQWTKSLERVLHQAPSGWELLLLGWNLDSCLQLGWGNAITSTSLFQPHWPDAEVLNTCLAEQDQHLWLRLQKALGLAGYVVSPAGASRILDWCLPLRTLPIQAANLPARPCFSLDGQLNSFYPELSAWVCIPPLVLGANDKPQSLTKV